MTEQPDTHIPVDIASPQIDSTFDPLQVPPGGDWLQDVGETGNAALTAGEVLNGYLYVFIVAFVVTMAVTPLIRKIALRTGIVDHPDSGRKEHRSTVPYLGGVAVFVGLVAAIGLSYVVPGIRPGMALVPLNVVIALTVILFTGLGDDVFHWPPNVKIGGQLVAAAFLAWDEKIGSRVAEGLLHPFEEPFGNLIGIADFSFAAIPIPIPYMGTLDCNVVHWVGAGIIAFFVLGGCNASNLIDGLDGLLTGTTAIMATALLAMSVLLAIDPNPVIAGELGAARVILCYALLGSVIGFLPYNFKPAVIFLGDAGSLLVGFNVIVIILLLGETGRTHLVFAGLIVFGLPIVDTTLAILRRKLNKLPISAPDAEHLHHMLKRTKLGVVGAVFVMYGITILFSSIGILLALVRARVVYALVFVLAGFIVVTGVKVARRRQVWLQSETMRKADK